MKQTSDKSEQAIRQLSDKLSEIITEAHTHTMTKKCGTQSDWSQLLNTRNMINFLSKMMIK